MIFRKIIKWMNFDEIVVVITLLSDFSLSVFFINVAFGKYASQSQLTSKTSVSCYPLLFCLLFITKFLLKSNHVEKNKIESFHVLKINTNYFLKKFKLEKTYDTLWSIKSF